MDTEKNEEAARVQPSGTSAAARADGGRMLRTGMQ